MAERVLSSRQLNRALLARQLLLGREKVPLTRAVERMGGLQTQYAPSGYIGLWSRVEGFERDALTAALERRRIVQGTLMRTTIHMVSKRDYWPFAIGVRQARRDQAVKVGRPPITEARMKAQAKRVRSLLADGPRRFDELAAVVKQHQSGLPPGRVGLWIDLVRAPPSGTWDRRRADLYALAEDWVGPPEATERQGLEHLARRYLGAFGPATLKDLANWAGVPPAAFESVVDGLGLRRFWHEEAELLDLPRAPIPDAETPAPVRFLPTWDATLLVHAKRTQILPERHRTRVFNAKTPHSVPTFLVDGQVAGTWKHERDKVVLEPFDRLPRTARRELDDEAQRLRDFLR